MFETQATLGEEFSVISRAAERTRTLKTWATAIPVVNDTATAANDRISARAVEGSFVMAGPSLIAR